MGKYKVLNNYGTFNVIAETQREKSRQVYIKIQTYIVPDVVGTIGISSASKGIDQGI